jgi:regulator of replication initiation timing
MKLWTIATITCRRKLTLKVELPCFIFIIKLEYSNVEELQYEIARLNALNSELQSINDSLVEENRLLKDRLSAYETNHTNNNEHDDISTPQPPATSEDDKVYQDSNLSYRDKVAFEIMQTGKSNIECF